MGFGDLIIVDGVKRVMLRNGIVGPRLGQSYREWQAEVAGVPYDRGREKEGWKSRARQKHLFPA